MTRGFVRHIFLSVPFSARVTSRQRLRFHLKIDFSVDIGGVDGNMSQPRADRIDVYSCTQKVRSRRVTNRVRTNSLFRQRRHLSLACFACLSTSVWIPKRVTGAP